MVHRCPGNVPHKNRGSGRMRVGAGQLTTFTGGFFMEYASKGLAGTALGFGIGGAALAKAFLLDKDGPGPEQKLMAYYEHIARS